MYGKTCVQVTLSQDFSKPRCRKPMSSFMPWMVSPSSSTTARTVPCMAGWLGPRLTSIRFDGNGASRGLSAGAA